MDARPRTAAGARDRQLRSRRPLFKQVSQSHAARLSDRHGRPESAPVARSPTKVSKPNDDRTTSRLAKYLSGLATETESSVEEEPMESDRGQLSKGGNLFRYELSQRRLERDTEKPRLVFEGDRNLATAEVLDVDCTKTFATTALKGGRAYVCPTGGQPIPVSVATALAVGVPRIARVSCGANHVLALLENGSVVGWGENNFGQLGLGIQSSQPTKGSAKAQVLPCFNELEISQICCGERHSLVVDVENRVFGIGDGRHGQLGSNGRRDGVNFSKVEIELNDVDQSNVEQLAAGENFSLILMQSKSLLAVGDSGKRTHQLTSAWLDRGASPESDERPQYGISVIFIPEIAQSLGCSRLTQIGARGSKCFAVSSNGKVAVWEHGNTKFSTVLESLSKMGVKVRHASIGFDGSLVAVSFTSNVYIWEDAMRNDNPVVIKQFATEGIKVNASAIGEGFLICGRKVFTAPKRKERKATESFIVTRPKTAGVLLLGRNPPISRQGGRKIQPTNNRVELEHEGENSIEKKQEISLTREVKDQVEPELQEICSEKCLVYGTPLAQIVAGQSRCTFRVQLRDGAGKVVLSRNQRLHLSGFVEPIQTDMKRKQAIAFQPKGDGSFEASFSADDMVVAGEEFSISVILGSSSHLGKSPYCTVIKPSQLSPKQCKGKLLVLDSDERQFRIHIQEKDKFGNNIRDLEIPSEKEKHRWNVFGIDWAGKESLLSAIRSEFQSSVFVRDIDTASIRVTHGSLLLELGNSPLAIQQAPESLLSMKLKENFGCESEVVKVSLGPHPTAVNFGLRAAYRFVPQNTSETRLEIHSGSIDFKISDVNNELDCTLALPGPRKVGIYKVEVEIHYGTGRQEHFELHKKFHVVCTATSAFLRTCALQDTEYIKEGFWFMLPTSEDLNDDSIPMLKEKDGKLISVSFEKDMALKQLSKQCIEICKYIPEPKGKGKVIASVIGDWCASQLVQGRQQPTRVGERTILDLFSRNLEIEVGFLNVWPKLGKHLLFKLLCDQVGAPCRIWCSKGWKEIFVAVSDCRICLESPLHPYTVMECK